jgi:hypothetical protein
MENLDNFSTKEFNLQSFTENFMRAMQQDFDLLAFTFTAHDRADESAYLANSLAPRIMPLAPFHGNFEQLQAHARDRLVRQVCADSLQRIVMALDHMHLFLHLVQNRQNSSGVRDAIQREIQSKQADYVKSGLLHKLQALELCFSIQTPFTAFVTALELVFDALVHHRGCVQDQHLNAGFSLVLLLQSVASSADGCNKLVEQRLVFEKNEVITFESLHLQQMLITVSIFADHLFRSVADYTQAHIDG